MPRQINRRVVLQGLGASVALPWLESGRLVGAEPEPTAAAGASPLPQRFAFLFFGDGIHPPEWWAKGAGEALEVGPAFASLTKLKSKVNFINGLCHSSDVVGGHARGAAGILTGIRPQGGREIRAATSMDQLLAQHLAEETPLPCLALACERPVSGFHESGYSMMYSSHVSWSSPVAPVPTELYPSLAFDSLFESQGSRTQLSVLDQVLEQLHDVSQKVSAADRAKIDEYTNSVREVELRLARLNRAQKEEAGLDPTTAEQRPMDGLPTRLDEHARLMCDVMALAFQADRTRVATMLLTNNLSGQVYPFLGLRDDHHSFSHSWQNQEFASITRFWVEQYAYLLTRLDQVQEGDGTVLDNCCIILANEQWTAHDAPRIPLLMAGGLGGTVATGRCLDFETSRNRRMSGLYLSLLDRMGVRRTEFGDATEPLTI